MIDIFDCLILKMYSLCISVTSHYAVNNILPNNIARIHRSKLQAYRRRYCFSDYFLAANSASQLLAKNSSINKNHFRKFYIQPEKNDQNCLLMIQD